MRCTTGNACGLIAAALSWVAALTGLAQPPATGDLPLLIALDADGDGELSAAELKRASASLGRLDQNRDGALSGAELNRRPLREGPPGTDRARQSQFGGREGPSALPLGRLPFRDGAYAIPDHATFHRLSYRGQQVRIDTFLADLEFVKFTLDQAGTSRSKLYFINTKTHRAHRGFGRAVSLPVRPSSDQMKGVLVYRPLLKSPQGRPGLYTFEFEPFDAYRFQRVKACYDMLVDKMPALEGNLGYYPRGPRALARWEEERTLYRRAAVRVYRDTDLETGEMGYLPLNPGRSCGRLRILLPGMVPGARDIVLCETLPNHLPRVSGMITAVRQTPLSHVNLRAVQDQVPNAFISDAIDNEAIRALVGKYVAYQVTVDGYDLRAAVPEEVASYFSQRRPTQKQVPPRDLAITAIRSLTDVRPTDSASVGAKAANLAALGGFGFPAGTIPEGFAVPFYFYDEFMKHNRLYQLARQLVANQPIQQDLESQDRRLQQLRSRIKGGQMPEWMTAAVTALHESFPADTPLRCRSSTNNEDLPGFSGAGLYDSFTHYPDEGHLSKTIKQVFAGLWTLRGFQERAFFRVDHFATAMGVLVHPHFAGELANGVAVTDDILYQTEGTYYLNVQVGEDLVTNPNTASVPEEGLLDWWDSRRYRLMRPSNRAADARSLLSPRHREQLRTYLGLIHARFARLHRTALEDETFAMEIEFKITAQGTLAIKQARPWIYTGARLQSGVPRETPR